ncbi:polysaccharide deacetylase family protein [Pseudomonadota bacterium]
MSPIKYAAITLDLEPDHAGQVSESYHCWTNQNIKTLTSVLVKYNTPLSIFVVGKTLKIQSKYIRLLQRHKTSFHLHSYSHDLAYPETYSEIAKGKRIYQEFFQKDPIGYRAPEGRISSQGLTHLKALNFKFDASFIPSFWPTPNRIFSPNHPHYLNDHKLLEIPFSTISPLKIPLSISWIRLMGWETFFKLLSYSTLPNQLIFNFHLHDLFPTPSTKHLSTFWKLVYHRNQQQGLEYLKRTLHLLNKLGYKFVLIDDIYQQRLQQQ